MALGQCDGKACCAHKPKTQIKTAGVATASTLTTPNHTPSTRQVHSHILVSALRAAIASRIVAEDGAVAAADLRPDALLLEHNGSILPDDATASDEGIGHGSVVRVMSTARVAGVTTGRVSSLSATTPIRGSVTPAGNKGARESPLSRTIDATPVRLAASGSDLSQWRRQHPRAAASVAAQSIATMRTRDGSSYPLHRSPVNYLDDPIRRLAYPHGSPRRRRRVVEFRPGKGGLLAEVSGAGLDDDEETAEEREVEDGQYGSIVDSVSLFVVGRAKLPLPHPPMARNWS